MKASAPMPTGAGKSLVYQLATLPLSAVVGAATLRGRGSPHP
jgi:superfamily II DNA helicase RecQ